MPLTSRFGLRAVSADGNGWFLLQLSCWVAEGVLMAAVWATPEALIHPTQRPWWWQGFFGATRRYEPTSVYYNRKERVLA